MGPIEIRRLDGPADVGARHLRDHRRRPRAGSQVGGERVVLERSTSVVLPQPFMGISATAGPPGRPRRARAGQTGARRAAVGAVPHARPWRVLLRGPERARPPPAAARSCRAIASSRSSTSPPISSSTRAAAGCAADSFRLTDVEATVRDYEFESLGWVYCQGGGYFGGFDDGLGQGDLPRRPARRGRGLGRQPPDDVGRPVRPVVRIRARLGRELHAAASRGHDRPRALRVRPHRHVAVTYLSQVVVLRPPVARWGSDRTGVS